MGVTTRVIFAGKGFSGRWGVIQELIDVSRCHGG